MANKRILVDSGTTDNFIHPKFIRRLHVGTQKLKQSMKIWNIDGSTNRAGQLTKFVDLLVQTRKWEEKMQFLITDLGIEDDILGYPWLSTFEPNFSWKDGVIDTTLLPVIIRSPDWHTLVLCPTIQSTQIGRTVTEEAKQKIVDILTGESQIGSIATDLAIKVEQYTEKVKVPEKYQCPHHVFSEEAAQCFPPKRPWDHTIDLKLETPNVINCKIYPLTQEEDKALVAFLKEQLKKRYIVPSKSPYASPFFFVKKKDSKL